MKQRTLFLGLMGVLASQAYLWKYKRRKNTNHNNSEDRSRAQAGALAALFFVATPLLVKKPALAEAVPHGIAKYGLSFLLPEGFEREEDASEDNAEHYSFKGPHNIGCHIQVSRKLVSDPGREFMFGREFWSNLAVPGSVRDTEIQGLRGFEWDLQAEDAWSRRFRIIYKGRAYDIWTSGPIEMRGAVIRLYQSVKNSVQFGARTAHSAAPYANRHLAAQAASAQD